MFFYFPSAGGGFCLCPTLDPACTLRRTCAPAWIYVCVRPCGRGDAFHSGFAVATRQSLTLRCSQFAADFPPPHLLSLLPFLVDCNSSLCTSVFPPQERWTIFCV